MGTETYQHKSEVVRKPTRQKLKATPIQDSPKQNIEATTVEELPNTYENVGSVSKDGKLNISKRATKRDQKFISITIVHIHTKMAQAGDVVGRYTDMYTYIVGHVVGMQKQCYKVQSNL